MPRQGNYKKPIVTTIETTNLCDYGCGLIAKYQFANGKLCCSTSHNSCPKKRKDFSEAGGHKERAAKSLETRLSQGITKTSQIKGAKTRKENGFYERQRKIMQQHWATNPWNNNLRCPLLPYKNLSLLYQGTHELKFLEKIEETYGLEWMRNNVRRGPSIWYDSPDGTDRLYISDFIIKDTVYEIKSSWTWNHRGDDLLLEEMNKAKLTACVKMGYNVILIIDGEETKWQ